MQSRKDGVGLGLLERIGSGGLTEGGILVGTAQLFEGVGVGVGFVDLSVGTAPVHRILIRS